MVVPPTLVPTLLALRQATDSGPPALIEAAVTALIAEGHLTRHLRRARRTYSERHTLLLQELCRRAPPSVEVLPAHAGLHVTLVAPNAPEDDELTARANERRIRFSSLRRSYRSAKPLPGVILGFGALASVDVPEAVRLLMEVLGH